ncbi:TIGR03899 family protein [Vibrio sp. VB16]|uniref:TIGR03899 family protein n=1 Tax=Vibrio sp. VB16 TaxID=2785746 RepID=UPI00189C93AE|nr:TIGR03899 family protein [Vibrio sp. VB16]UGA55088.1 TIGR03899 family protein [Vibrio sp. VB16]
MAEKRAPVTIDNSETNQNSDHSKKKSSYIKDSASRVASIAETYGLEALLQSSPTQKSILERALNRDKQRREQRQKNLETIIKFSHSFCNDETAGDPDQDWLNRFFDLAQDIHNSSMQRLWAQILKLEVTNPGSTSVKALQVLKDMTPKEAQYLQKAAALSCSFGGDNSKKLLIGFRTQSGLFSFTKRDVEETINLGSYQLPYSSILLLIELGLVIGTELESGEIEFDPALLLDYQGKIVSLQPMGKGSRLLYYRLSPVGNELCKLLGNKPNMKYFDQLVGLLSQKFTVQTETKGTIDQLV